MSAIHHREPFPKNMLRLAGLVVGSVLVMTIALRVAHVPPQASPVLERASNHVVAVRSRDLSFADASEGSVLIVDAATGVRTSGVAAGATSGFIRGVMRGLMRDRQRRGVGVAPPFRLTLWANGQLSITDSTSGYVTDLSAFGATNRAAFEALLK